ncbi:MAG TPA: GNAT family N-acetyltransferase [Ilumatobacteraceae bacterium]|nr:GNAT family N-acetyltransferase [Ilumatobacteraceae bacterium]
MTSSRFSVVDLAPTDTHGLRRAVLRNGDPAAIVTWPGDDVPGVFHLGVRDASGTVVATSSWMPRQHPDLDRDADPETGPPRSIQLRGMATATAVQGSGVGGLLLEAGIARCTDLGFDLLFARARDAALAFYARHGCEVVGDGFVDETTQLPHHLVVRRLRAGG